MKAYAALVALASAANAHMIMKTPIPAGAPISSPLEPSGGNFPCQTGPGKLDTSKPNVMSVGSPNTLSFTGSATHGGGSCQISLAKGTDLSADTKWMVIHSTEGGCPAPNNGNQNLGNDPNGSGASQFSFTIPDHPDLGAGDYTLAWTWNNRIGNREFYMNCAYVQLSGPAKKRYAPSKPAISKRQQAPLPDMFVANLGNGCTSPEGIDVEYPDPGQSLEIGPGANLGKPSGNCGAVGAAPANPGGSNSGQASSAFGGNPTASNTVNPVNPTATGGFATGNPGDATPTNTRGFGGGRGSSVAGNPNNGQYTQTNPNVFATVSAGAGAESTGSPDTGMYTQSVPNVFATGAASQSAPAQTAVSSASVQQPSAPVATPPSEPEPSATSAPAPASPNSPAGTGPSSTSSTLGECSTANDGEWSCSADGKYFQRCASGAWSVPMQMAGGTSCVPGISANFAYAATGNNVSGNSIKRDLRSHIARRRHNLHSPFSS